MGFILEIITDAQNPISDSHTNPVLSDIAEIVKRCACSSRIIMYSSISNMVHNPGFLPRIVSGEFYPAENEEFLTAVDNITFLKLGSISLDIYFFCIPERYLQQSADTDR